MELPAYLSTRRSLVVGLAAIAGIVIVASVVIAVLLRRQRRESASPPSSSSRSDGRLPGLPRRPPPPPPTPFPPPPPRPPARPPPRPSPQEVEAVLVRQAGQARLAGDPGSESRALQRLGAFYEEVGRPHDAMSAYVNAFATGAADEAALRVARMYAFGAPPRYLPDKVAAKQIYETLLAATGPAAVTDDVRRVAYESLLELTTLTRAGYDPDAIATDAGQKRLDPAHVWSIRRAIEERRPVVLRRRHERPEEPPSLFDELFAAEPFELARDDDGDDPPPDHALALRLAGGDLEAQQRLLNEAAGRMAAAAAAAEPMRHQNVHSSSAQGMAVARLAALESKDDDGVIGRTEFERAVREFHRDVGITAISPEERDAALRVLDSLTTNVHSRYDRTEQEVFVRVWARINAPENGDRRTSMLNVLVQNLASGIEHGIVVCSTGKIMRMLGSLDAMDADPSVAEPLKPEWAIDREIAALASSIRSKALDAVDGRTRERYESGDDEKTSEAMRTELRRRVREDYVDSGILSVGAAELRAQPYLDAL